MSPTASWYSLQGWFHRTHHLSLFITVIALAIERWFAISTANGKGNLGKFAAAVKSALKQGDVNKAEQLCNKQQGSVANVVLAALTEYKKQQGTDLETEKKVLAIQKTIEEATALEMPMMQENLPIIGDHRNARYAHGSSRYGYGYDQVVLGHG